MGESLAYQFNNEGNIPFLRELAEQKDTFIEKITETMHIGLLPSALGKLKTGIHDNLNSKLRKYDPQLDGILVGYDNLALLGSNGHMIPGYYYIHINIKADFYVFKPKVGGTLTGTVLKKSGSNATCLTNKVFTVFVTFPPHMRQEIHLHQDISFTIEKVDLLSQIPFVKGVLNENSVSGGSHARFDSPEPAAVEPDSGLSSIGEEAPGVSPTAVADPTPRRHRKRRDREQEAAGEESTEVTENPSPRKSKKRRREEDGDAGDQETSSRKSKKRHRSDAAAAGVEAERVVVKLEPVSVKLEPVSESEQELYLADTHQPVSSRKKKRRRERAELNGSVSGMLR